MTVFPITGRFVGDSVPHLMLADTDDTIDTIGRAVAALTVGRRIAHPAPPGLDAAHYDVLLDDRVLPAHRRLGDVVAEQRLLPLQWFDVRFHEPHGD